MRWLAKQVLTIGIPLAIEHIHRHRKARKAEAARHEAEQRTGDEARDELRDRWTR